MKSLTLFIIFIISGFNANAQTVRPLLSLSADKNDQFVNNAFVSIALGAEVKAADFLQPQIEAVYTYALLNENNTYNSNFQIDGESQAKFSAYAVGITPKFLVYRDDDGYYSLNILPKYTYSKAFASNFFSKLDASGLPILPYSNSSATDIQHSLGIGIGFCVNFSKINFDSMAINLYWNNIEYGNATNQLKDISRTITTASNIGFGLVYYWSLKKNIEKGFIEPKI